MWGTRSKPPVSTLPVWVSSTRLTKVLDFLIGLENQNRDTATHVVGPANKSFYFAFVTPYQASSKIYEHIQKHGDGVFDVCFQGIIFKIRRLLNS